jgi:hypothetical protein
VTYKKSSVVGVPEGEKRLVDAKKLGLHIRSAAMIADPPMKDAGALARAMTAMGCETSVRQVQDWEGGRAVPRLTPFLVIVALTAPVGGLKYFATAWPELWPLIEQGLNGQSNLPPEPEPRPKQSRRKP